MVNVQEAAMVRKQKVVSEIDLGTEQTRKRLRPDPIQSMASTWGRNYRDIMALEAAAREIRRIFVMQTSALHPKAVDMSHVPGASIPLPEWLATRRRSIYNPWAAEIGTDKFNVVIHYLVDEYSLEQLDKSIRKRKGTAKRILVHCLTKYAQLTGSIRTIATIA